MTASYSSTIPSAIEGIHEIYARLLDPKRKLTAVGERNTSDFLRVEISGLKDSLHAHGVVVRGGVFTASQDEVLDEFDPLARPKSAMRELGAIPLSIEPMNHPRESVDVVCGLCVAATQRVQEWIAGESVPECVEVRAEEPYGLGLFAAAAGVPRGTRIGCYHGYIVNLAEHSYPNNQYLSAFGTSLMFAVNPAGEDGVLLPEFRLCVATRINEPAPGLKQNCAWRVRDGLPAEVWTTDDIPPGAQLFIGYGLHHNRSYEVGDPEYRVVSAPTSE